MFNFCQRRRCLFRNTQPRLLVQDLSESMFRLLLKQTEKPLLIISRGSIFTIDLHAQLLSAEHFFFL